MAKQALFFIIIFILGNICSLRYGPFYGLLTYIHIYFNIPTHQYWANQVPALRWSFICAIILAISCVLHKDKLSSKHLSSTFYILIGYFLLVIISAFISPFPNVSFSKIYEFLRYLIIFYLILKIVNSFDQFKYVIGLIVLETFNICLLATARYRGGRIDIGIVDAGGSNSFGGVLVIVCWFIFILFFAGGKKTKLLCIIISPIIVNVFIMCGSRGAFLALLSSGVIVLIDGIQEMQYRKKILTLSVLGLVLLFTMMDSGYKERLVNTFLGGDDHEVSEVSAGRTEIWKIGLIMSKDYPWGAGGGSFLMLSRRYMPDELLEKRVGQRASHSTYILTLVEQGMLGLMLFCFFLIQSIRMLYIAKSKNNRYLKNQGTNEKTVVIHSLSCLGMIAAIVAYASFSIFGDRLYFEMLYILCSLAVCMADITSKYIDQMNKEQGVY